MGEWRERREGEEEGDQGLWVGSDGANRNVKAWEQSQEWKWGRGTKKEGVV